MTALQDRHFLRSQGSKVAAVTVTVDRTRAGTSLQRSIGSG